MFDILKRKSPVTPTLSHLPTSWNKDWFHFVNIHIGDLLYVGYLWATDNWVEIHCFDHVSIETVYKITGKQCELGSNTEISCHNVTIYRPAQMLWANKGFVFDTRIISAITPRENVNFSCLDDSHEFYSKKYGFRDSVYTQLSNDDLEHWKRSHPQDDYKKIFSGSTEVGWYCYESHQGMKMLYTLRNGEYKYLGYTEDINLTYF